MRDMVFVAMTIFKEGSMPFGDQLFTSLFPAAKVRELEDLNTKSYAEVQNDLEGMKERFDDLAICNKQLAIMINALYNLLLEKDVINKDEFKKKLDSIDLSDWV